MNYRSFISALLMGSALTVGFTGQAFAAQNYDEIAISQVSDYVNVRSDATTASEKVGKIYNNCAAEILETVEGEGGTWYKIKSGTVNGYIKAQYFVTGEAAKQLAPSIGTSYARVVNGTNLRLRQEPNTESQILDLLSSEYEYEIIDEQDNFAKIAVDTDLIGYVSKDYIEVRVQFDEAVSVEEEAAKEQQAQQLKLEADQALANMVAVKAAAGDNSGLTITPNPDGGSASVTENAISEITKPGENNVSGENNSTENLPSPGAGGLPAANPETEKNIANSNANGQTAPGMVGGSPVDAKEQTTVAKNDKQNSSGVGPGGGSLKGGNSAIANATRSAIVAYAKQFLGNPYVYGGTSLTNGTDCSGFTQGIYKNFGITTGRTSRDQAEKGRQISVDSAQPGDLLFYASGNYINHVAMYIGNGQVIHASNSKTGIIISPANYRTPCKAVTFLD